jgi:hypothetical protein
MMHHDDGPGVAERLQDGNRSDCVHRSTTRIQNGGQSDGGIEPENLEMIETRVGAANQYHAR